MHWLSLIILVVIAQAEEPNDSSGPSSISTASGPSSTDQSGPSATGLESTSSNNHPLPGSPEYALQVALAAKDLPRSACQHTSCDTCASDSECGWCEIKGKCMAGDALGPSPGVVSEPCSLWSFGGCIGTDCRNLQKCSDCMSNSDCGWCESDCSCTDKHTSDPTTPAYGECDKGWFVADGWSKKTCPLHLDSTCLTVTKIHEASAEALQEKELEEQANLAKEKAEQDELKDIHSLNAKTYPKNLRIIGKISMVGIDPVVISNEKSKQIIREILAKTFNVDVQAVALPLTIQIIPLMDVPKPNFLIETHRTKTAKGFFGGLFARVKNIFKAKKQKQPQPPPPPPPSADVKFKIGCKTKVESDQIFQTAQNLMVDSKQIENDIGLQIPQVKKNVIHFNINYVKQGEEINTLEEPRQEDGNGNNEEVEEVDEVDEKGAKRLRLFKRI